MLGNRSVIPGTTDAACSTSVSPTTLPRFARILLTTSMLRWFFLGRAGATAALRECDAALRDLSLDDASLRVKLANGKVVEADLDTPTDVNIALVETVTAQQELGDALSAVASLDLSPWEVRG